MYKQTPGLIPVLKSAGYSLTKPRIAVFDALLHSESLSMNELVRANPEADRASVYRTVDLFEKLGIVHRIQIGWKYKLELSEMFREHHHHAVCNICGQILPVPEDNHLENLIHNLGESIDFQISNHALELRGVCKSCSH